MKGLRDRVEKLEKNVKNLEKIEKPIKEDKGIDNERFNMILEKTKRNIEMAMSKIYFTRFFLFYILI